MKSQSYSPVQIAFKYLDYFLRASSGKGHGIHSPFVFDFISSVLNDKRVYPPYESIEQRRKELEKDKSNLLIQDFGAGSSFDKSERRSVAAIARNAVKSRKYGQLLFRMIQKYQPQTILELGTSLGITSSYLASALPSANFITIEASEAIAALAEKTFRHLNLSNVRLVVGNFDDSLPAILNSVASIDFAFVDGNHQQLPTENYFQQLLPKTHDNSILIFDDIHWSSGMETAWSNIRKHKSVLCSIDIFFMGIILFRPEFREQQHFTIRF